MAKLLPLKGKYYGAEIEWQGELDGPQVMRLWLEDWSTGYRPSDRWLEANPDWAADKDGYDHVEQQFCYEAALGLVAVLTKLGR